MITKLFLPTLLSEREAGEANLEISKQNAGVFTKSLIVTDGVQVGFVRACNRGLREMLCQGGIECGGKPPYVKEWDSVCILSDDLYFPDAGWLTRMREVLFSDESYMAVGPSVKCGTLPQKNGTPSTRKGIEVVSRLCFTGILIKRTAVEDVGLLDEEMFIHCGADYDWIHRGQERGWRAVWVRDVWCVHDWHPSTAPAAWVAQDRNRFYKKWTRTGQRR